MNRRNDRPLFALVAISMAVVLAAYVGAETYRFQEWAKQHCAETQAVEMVRFAPDSVFQAPPRSTFVCDDGMVYER